MLKWISFSLFLVAICSWGGDLQRLPRPLPDENYPQEPYPGEPRGEFLYSLGNGQTGRAGARTQYFFPLLNFDRLAKVRLSSVRNHVEIREVRIIFTDKKEMVLRRLSGELFWGDFREASLEGRRVSRIDVTASTSPLWREVGTYHVEVVALR